MNTIQNQLTAYLEYCQYQSRLDEKTLKAYRTDLTQFIDDASIQEIDQLSLQLLEEYIVKLNQLYKPKTVKRKISSMKSFFHYLEYRDLLDKNPFHKLHIKFRDPITLPKTIPLKTIELLLTTVYRQSNEAKTEYKKKNALRDAAVIELLFSTGMRISELCGLKEEDVNLTSGNILIHGKGAKERYIQIGNKDVMQTLLNYKNSFKKEIDQCNHFFAQQSGEALSDQAVRRKISKYTNLAAIEQHITPHMFRHTFASCLLDAGVDIRYIQEMLGHSSITVTEIYTHVSSAKQQEILTNKHPRKDFHI